MYSLDDFEIVLTAAPDAAQFESRKTGLALAWGAIGGAEWARWEEEGNEDDLWQWVNRLGAEIEVYDPFADRVWEGFVNSARLRVRGAEMAFSLDQMWNRLAIVFSYVSYLCPSSGDFKINGTPSGSTLNYDDGAGGDPAGEADLAVLTGGTALWNTTQEEEAVIQSVDDSTNQITLTGAVPGTWADNDDLLYGTVMGRAFTSWVDDTDSQTQYGVKEKLWSRAGLTATTAANERDALLDLWAWPLGEHGRGRGGRGQRADRVTVEAVGWWARCKWRLWNWDYRGQLSAQDQVKLIRTQKLDFLSTDESRIEDTGHLFTQYREDWNDAQKELIALADLGDATTQERVVVGVEQGKRLFFRKAQTATTHVVRNGVWQNYARQRIYPWQVRPDGYVVVEDQVPQTVVLGGVADPSRYYAERVEWKWPDTVVVTPLGGRDLEELINRGVRL